jgi:hypothetical protein
LVITNIDKERQSLSWLVSKEHLEARHRWLTPVILITQEPEIKRITVKASLGKIVWETLSWKCEALSSNPSAAKKRKKAHLERDLLVWQQRHADEWYSKWLDSRLTSLVFYVSSVDLFQVRVANRGSSGTYLTQLSPLWKKPLTLSLAISSAQNEGLEQGEGRVTTKASSVKAGMLSDLFCFRL